MKPCREAAGVVPRSCHPPAAVECLVGSLLSPPPLPLHTSLGPCLCCCRASPHRVVAIEGAWEWGAPHSRCRRRWGWGYPLLPLSCRCGPGCSGNRVVVMVVAVWCTPRRRRGIGAHLVVLVAVGASCSFSRPWVLPRSSSWPCGAPRSSPWMPPHRSCGRVVAPTRPRGLGYTSLLVPMVVWSCGAPWSSSWPCGASPVVVAAVGTLEAVGAPPSSLWPCGGPRSSSWLCGAPPACHRDRVVGPPRSRGRGCSLARPRGRVESLARPRGHVVPPGRCRQRGCPPVILVAVWWPPLVLVALNTSSLVPMVVWSCGAPPSSLWPCGDPRSSSWLCGAPPLVVMAMWWPPLVLEAWVLPRLSSWPCGAPWLSLLPWMPPRRPCGRVVSPACPHGLGYLLARPYGRVVPPLVVVVARPPWSSSSPWVPLRSWVPSRCPCGCVVAPARPHGRVVPPCLSLWPCGGPPSFSRPWVLPCSSSWPCGASLVVVVAVGALDAVDAPPVVLVAVGTSLLVPVVVWCPLVAVIAVWCVPGGRRGCVHAWW